jgi:hypothetical protein
MQAPLPTKNRRTRPDYLNSDLYTESDAKIITMQLLKELNIIYEIDFIYRNLKSQIDYI